jgi:hypothetical protein
MAKNPRANSTVVEQLTHNPEIKGSNPATGTITENMAKTLVNVVVVSW